MTQINTSLERLQEIEKEREETRSNPHFYKWMQELNVSSSVQDRTGILNAKDLMVEWDSTRFRITIQ